MISRRVLVQTAVASGATAALPATLTAAFAQSTSWPEAPVKIIVPFTAGGASDVLTRALAEKLQGRLGQNFVVDNRTGAGGNIGMQAVRGAPADGYTKVLPKPALQLLCQCARQHVRRTACRERNDDFHGGFGPVG